ncbi:MAG TPA: patatin-like phospholipase family protein, partial [Solirubrobacteraceae bacterium]|nr:patatin-like phospholipase family protein [Solirubrobacteraceae bacterium]
MAVDPWVEEVRVALALNGGVSLAVWMGGCAVELDRARRTRCAWRPGDSGAADAGARARAAGGDPGPRSTYGALCDAFRRELVVDVMSGSSAGGINGALLAGAMTHGRVLDADYLRDRWLTLGDFSKLLHPLGEREPAALMRGRYFAEELERTFTDLLTQAPADDMPAVVPALDVTATDVAGRSLTFRDAWGGALHGREFRARFRFRRAGDFTAQNLAAAARASASFPLAFEPFRVPPGPPSELAGLDGGSWVIDGGLLDNAPIRAALELIPTRPASRQVRRFLCYLNGEPDPGDAAAGAGGPAAGAAQRGEPPTRDVVGLVVNLPRKAPFAEHLLALQGVARRSPLAHEAELSLLSLGLGDLQATATALLPSYRRRRRMRALQEVLPEPGDAQRAFDALERAALDLPWLPATLATPADAWPWGFEPARR